MEDHRQTLLSLFSRLKGDENLDRLIRAAKSENTAIVRYPSGRYMFHDKVSGKACKVALFGFGGKVGISVCGTAADEMRIYEVAE